MPPGEGYGKKGRGRGRGQSSRQSRPAGRGRAGMRGEFSSERPKGLGRQLERRVKSGSITQERAQKTSTQRQTLRKAFGKDWRVKVFGDRGFAHRTRVAAAKDPSDPQVGALGAQLTKRRKQMLARARVLNEGTRRA